jgi:hypothetical protein
MIAQVLGRHMTTASFLPVQTFAPVLDGSHLRAISFLSLDLAQRG